MKIISNILARNIGNALTHRIDWLKCVLGEVTLCDAEKARVEGEISHIIEVNNALYEAEDVDGRQFKRALKGLK